MLRYVAYFSHSPEKQTPGSNNSLGKWITELESKCLSIPDGPGNIVHSPLYIGLVIFKVFSERSKANFLSEIYFLQFRKLFSACSEWKVHLLWILRYSMSITWGFEEKRFDKYVKEL